MLSANFKPKTTVAASRGSLAAARPSCYYSNQLDSAVLNVHLWTESEQNLTPLDAFSGLFYAQNAFASPLGSLQRSPRPHSWWGGGSLPHSKNPTPALGPSGVQLCPSGRAFPLFLFYETTIEAPPAGFGAEPRKIWILEHFGTLEITSEWSASF